MLVIGIGAGNPEHMTMQAVRALREADVFFLIDNRAAPDLVRVRREIFERYVEGHSYRVVSVTDPERDPATTGYEEAIAAWRSARAVVWEQLVARELGEDGVGAFLIWGDPALYDSAIVVLDDIAAAGRVRFEVEVVPGISSAQALAAAHRVALTRLGEPVTITTGRRLRAAPPDGDAVVMLDADAAFDAIDDPDTEIFWGAYVGTEHELLVSGRIGDVADEIKRLRAEARERHGWIMDVYLLRRPPVR